MKRGENGNQNEEDMLTKPIKGQQTKFQLIFICTKRIEETQQQMQKNQSNNYSNEYKNQKFHNQTQVNNVDQIPNPIKDKQIYEKPNFKVNQKQYSEPVYSSEDEQRNKNQKNIYVQNSYKNNNNNNNQRQRMIKDNTQQDEYDYYKGNRNKTSYIDKQWNKGYNQNSKYEQQQQGKYDQINNRQYNSNQTQKQQREGNNKITYIEQRKQNDIEYKQEPIQKVRQNEEIINMFEKLNIHE